MNKDIYIIKIQFIIKNWIKMTVEEQPSGVWLCILKWYI